MSYLTPLIIDSLIFLAGAVLLEFIIFLLFVLKDKLNIGRILIAVFSVNFITTLLGVFIPTGETTLAHYIWFGIAFLLAVVVEWLIYIPFFMNNTIKNSRLLFIAFVANFITYLIFGILIYKELLMNYI